MTISVFIQSLLVVSTGLTAGILMGDRAGAALARPQLAAASFIQLQQTIHRVFSKLMPVLMLTAVVSGWGWMWILRGNWQAASFWLIAIGAASIFAIIVMTRVVSVPINNQLMTWDPEAPPANMRELWAPWERVHTIRTVLAVAAFILEVVALSLLRAWP